MLEGKQYLTPRQIVAEAQKTGGTAAFVDAEHALDPNYADKLGVNVDELLVSLPLLPDRLCLASHLRRRARPSSSSSLLLSARALLLRRDCLRPS